MIWRIAPRWLAVGTVLFALQSAFPPLLLLALKRVLDIIGMGRGGAAGPAIAVALALAVGETIVRGLATATAEGQTLVLGDAIRLRIAACSAALPLAVADDPRLQDLRHAAIDDGPLRAPLLAAGINTVLRASLTLTGLAVVILRIQPVVVLPLAAFLAAIVIARLWRDRGLHARHLRTAVLDRRADYMWTLLTAGAAAKEVRVFGLGEHLTARLRAILTPLRAERFAIARQRIATEAATQTIAELALFAGLAALAWRAAEGGITLGSVVIAFWAIQFGRALVGELLGGLSGVHDSLAGLTSLHAFLDLATEPVGTAAPTGDFAIDLHGAGLHYPGATAPSIIDVTLTIAPGTRLAVVGDNGSGKTSLINLICGLHAPTTGEVRIGGVPLATLAPEARRRCFSVLSQDFVRYELTARDNVHLGRIDRAGDDPAIGDAVVRAGASETIARLPVGLDTQLGRRFDGAELSLGQWQKLALARALVRDAPILILDEPTSALDAAAERDVFDRLWRETAGRTVIVVSHRLSTVRAADTIVVLAAGRIVEQGNHDELLAAGGIYATMFTVQAAPYRPAEPDHARRA